MSTTQYSTAHYGLDVAHAADCAAFDRGRAKGQLEASVDMARSWLLDLARDDEWIATGMARAHWGQGWSDLIARQASGVDW